MIRRLPRFNDGYNPVYDISDYNNRSNINYDNAVSEYNKSGIWDPYLNYEMNSNVKKLGDLLLTELNSKNQSNSTGIRKTSTRRIKRPIKSTTAIQDRKAADKVYAQAVTAANKKAAAENAAANKLIKEGQAILKRNNITGEKNSNGETVYSEYANMNAGAVGKKRNSNSATHSNVNNPTYTNRYPDTNAALKRPTHNIPGLSSDSGAKDYWTRRKAQIASQKKAKGESTEDIFTRFYNWMKRNGVGRKVSNRPIVTTRGVGSYR